MRKEGSTKIENFMTPGAGVLALGRGHISHLVKIHYFFKNLLLYSQAYLNNPCPESYGNKTTLVHVYPSFVIRTIYLACLIYA